MVDLSVGLRKLRLASPVMPAAGTFGFGAEYAELYDLSLLGALVTKTLTLRPRSGNPPPRLWETPCGLLNSIGLENPGLDAFLAETLPKVLAHGVPVVVSLYGETPEEVGEMARRIPPEVAALELNLSCPNVPGKLSVLPPAEIAARVQAAREAFPGELWAKISPRGTSSPQAWPLNRRGRTPSWRRTPSGGWRSTWEDVGLSSPTSRPASRGRRSSPSSCGSSTSSAGPFRSR